MYIGGRKPICVFGLCIETYDGNTRNSKLIRGLWCVFSLVSAILFIYSHFRELYSTGTDKNENNRGRVSFIKSVFEYDNINWISTL